MAGVITRCPACATLFRVVPDQLRIAEGWVRCGHCAEVFDANEHLHSELAQAAEPAPVGPDAGGHEGPAPAPAENEAEADVEASSAPELPGALDAHQPPPGPMPIDILLDEPAPHAPAANEPLGAPPDPAGTAADADAQSEVPASASATASAPASPSTELVPVQAGAAPANEPAWYAEYKRGFDSPPEPGAEDELVGPDLDELSFVREARSRAFWDSPAVKTVLALLALTLVLLLAAQVALYWRDRLAAMQPALRPLLELLCRPSGCVVGTPRQIESVVIDNSSFNRLGPDNYRLALTLRNRSVTNVALPSIELTLTDAAEQPLVRRVLSPQELGFTTPAVISPGSERSTTVDLSLGADPLATRVAGYRLLAFYP